MNTRILFSTAAVLLSSVWLARADMTYVQETLMPAEAKDKVLSTLTTYRAKGVERTEMLTSAGPMTMKSVTITNCGQKQMITLDDTLKIYYNTPLTPNAATSDSDKVQANDKTGTIIMTLVSVRSLGRETINGVETPVYEVAMRYQTSGCLGVSDTTTRQQIAHAQPASLADEQADGACPQMSAEEDNDGCRTQVVRKGDWSLYDSIVSGAPLRTRILGEDGKVMTETRTRNVSAAKLDAALFSVPVGYKLVSKDKFEQSRQKAMMESISKAAGK